MAHSNTEHGSSTAVLTIDAYVDATITTTAANLVNSRAIARDDREDLEQELRLAVLSSAGNYNPEKASWHTYANRVVQRAVKMYLRGRYAACRDPRKCRHFSIDSDGSDENTGLTLGALPDHHHDDVERQAEFSEIIRVVVHALPTEQRDLAEALMALPSGQARAYLGWGKDRFYTIRRKLADSLETAGLATC